MTYEAILAAAGVLLLAFAIERLASVTRIPSVVFLIASGLIAKPLLGSFDVHLTGLDAIVPVLGTIGLVLIVLEGAFDLELRRETLKPAAASFFVAAAGLVMCAATFAWLGQIVLKLDKLQALILALPLSVISSAIAISSSGFLPKKAREFIIYETSLSDILGILIFFSLVNAKGTLQGALSELAGGGAISIFLSALCSVGLVVLLMRMQGHIRFVPLLAGLFALYALGKLMHLSPLIMVLFFGLVLNNPHLLTRFQMFSHLADDRYETTLNEFKTLTMELTFAVRGFFFILLGYWTDLSGLAEPSAWLTSAVVLFVIFGTRRVLLRLLRLNLAEPLTWIAPRGLITVLLYLSAKEAVIVPPYFDGAVILVILASSILIALGRHRWEKSQQH